MPAPYSWLPPGQEIPKPYSWLGPGQEIPKPYAWQQDGITSPPIAAPFNRGMSGPGYSQFLMDGTGTDYNSSRPMIHLDVGPTPALLEPRSGAVRSQDDLFRQKFEKMLGQEAKGLEMIDSMDSRRLRQRPSMSPFEGLQMLSPNNQPVYSINANQTLREANKNNPEFLNTLQRLGVDID